MTFNGEKHTSIDSTQSLLKERLKQNPELLNGYYVLAETQSGGRGRSDHTWVSLAGNLHVSILLRDLPFSEITWIPLWVSLCVHQALVELGVDGFLIQLKWPNDLWIERSRKVGGILCEKIGSSVVIGIGLNLVEKPKIAQETGAVSQLGYTFSPDEVLAKILEKLARPTSVEKVRKSYEQFALFRSGALIEWRKDQTEELCTGAVIGLGAYGELLVKSGDKILSLFTEDVRSVRLG